MTRWAWRLVGAASLIGLTASPASAQWFLAAGFGRALPPPGVGAERTFTLELGGVSRHGWLGAEADYGVMPSLENGGEARTFSGSLLIGPKTGSGWRPYGSVGFGHLGPVNTFSDNFRLYGTTAPPSWAAKCWKDCGQSSKPAAGGDLSIVGFRRLGSGYCECLFSR